MERIFEGIPLDSVSTSFTINATAPTLLAMYQVVGEQQGVDPAALRGTVQNDILKEYLARKTYIYPPGPSMRLAADVIEYCTSTLPKFNPISVCGYHMRQAGCDAVQEIALALSNAAAYVQAVVDRGIPVDNFAPQISFNISTMRDFFEEVAKHRAARRIWARVISERFGSSGSPLVSPAALLGRRRNVADGGGAAQQHHADHAAGAGDRAQRRAGRAHDVLGRGARPAVRGVGAAGAADAADHRPRERRRAHRRSARRLLLRRGADRRARPRASAMMASIEEHGGIMAGIEDGSLEHAIAESAYEQQRQIESGERVIVGVNRFGGGEDRGETATIDTFVVGPDVLERQLARLRQSGTERDEDAVAAALARSRRSSGGVGEHDAGDDLRRSAPTRPSARSRRRSARSSAITARSTVT